MEESILISIKKLLGVDASYNAYDIDISTHINSVFLNLNQLGVGPKNGFYIKDDKTKWSEYIQDETKVEFVKSYIYIKVKLIFDPPSSSFVLESLNRQAAELEWRLKVHSDSKEVDNNE